MNSILILTALIIIFALVFDFINGFHDTANAIATAVSTKALKTTSCNHHGCGHEFIGSTDLYRCSAYHYKGYRRSFHIE